MDISAWLKDLRLSQYEKAFVDNAIDPDVLPTLTAEDLKELGITAIGHRRKLLSAIAQLNLAARAGSDLGPSRVSTPIDAERRQVAVLFADLVGYTRLSGELDAEEVHALLERFFTIVDTIVVEHGGHLDKHIGDAAMAVFGAPVAHGNDTERAARAALAIRAAMQELTETSLRPVSVHIGIACGQVIASDTGSPEHRSYTVTGEGVNLASRLTDAAQPGEVLISETSNKLLLGRARTEPVSELHLKGIVEPIRAWRLLDMTALSKEHRPIADRMTELRQFAAVLQICREVSTGQLVHVRGEAGIGKTRLVEEFQRLASDEGFRCHTGLVLDFGAGSGKDAVRALVRSMLGLTMSSSAGSVAAATDAALKSSLVDSADEVFLNDLLDRAQPTDLRSAYDAMSNETRIEGKRRTLYQLAERSSRLQPHLLVIEDLHWADVLTLNYIVELTNAAAGSPLVVVTTSRTEGDPINLSWRQQIAGSVTTMDLGPLPVADARALAGALIETSAESLDKCVERAAGNPLFLEQLIRHTETGANTFVPGSVLNLVQARLDRLDLSDRVALQAASVVGQRFTREILCFLVGNWSYEPERLIGRHLVRQQGEELLFAHALIRDAVYDSLLKSRRRDLHSRAATWFATRDPVLYAEHLERAEDPRAARAYLAASQAQAGEYRYETALRLVRHGLPLAERAVDKVQLRTFEGRLLHDLGRMGEALRAYESALSCAQSDSERCHAWIGLAAVKRITDDFEGAFADLDRAEAATAINGLAAEEARVHYLRGNLLFPRGDFEGCFQEHNKGLELARNAGDIEAEASALGGLGDAEYARGRMISAYERLRECVQLCRAHGLGRIEVANLAQMAVAKTYFAPQGEALADSLDARQAAAAVGHQRAELAGALGAAMALFALQDLDRCREMIERAQQLVRALGAWRFEPNCLNYLGRLALSDGRRSEAIDLLQRAAAMCRDSNPGFQGPRILGALAAALDDPVAKRRTLAEADALVAAGCVAHNQLRYYPDAIDISLELADLGEAERYATALEDFARAEPLPWANFFVARGRSLVARARGCADLALQNELIGLSKVGSRMGYVVALPAIEAALAGMT